MSSGIVAALDIGGHYMRCWVADEQGRVLAQERRETKRDARTAEENLERLIDLIMSAVRKAGRPVEELRSTALGVPGAVDPDEGVIKMIPNIPHWDGLRLRDRLRERLAGVFAMDNDVNLAARGELWKGVAQGQRNFVFLAFGSGIGGGVVINGEVYRGSHNAAGEVGYLVLEPDSLDRFVGDMGWFESVAGGLALDRKAADLASRRPESRLAKMVRGSVAKAPDLFAAAEAGDDDCRRILDRTFEYIAMAVVNITSLLDPDMIVFGGGISAQGDRLLLPVAERARRYRLPVPPLYVSALGEEAQLWGALDAAFEHCRKPAGSG
ncbi:MAG TPA: ROK family protein [Acidobacteriota bacterium]|nr:ROK family protein [Acidobacteriota bacterium]HRV09309.1 ROK family protein [Acidobacteriota bacterium]